MQKRLKKPEQIGFVAIRLPIEMHREFRRWCIRNDTSMQEMIENYIEEILSKRD